MHPRKVDHQDEDPQRSYLRPSASDCRRMELAQMCEQVAEIMKNVIRSDMKSPWKPHSGSAWPMDWRLRAGDGLDSRWRIDLWQRLTRDLRRQRPGTARVGGVDDQLPPWKGHRKPSIERRSADWAIGGCHSRAPADPLGNPRGSRTTEVGVGRCKSRQPRGLPWLHDGSAQRVHYRVVRGKPCGQPVAKLHNAGTALPDAGAQDCGPN